MGTRAFRGDSPLKQTQHRTKYITSMADLIRELRKWRVFGTIDIHELPPPYSLQMIDCSWWLEAGCRDDLLSCYVNARPKLGVMTVDVAEHFFGVDRDRYYQMHPAQWLERMLRTRP